MGGMLPSAAMTALQMGMDMAQQKQAQSQAKDEARAQAQQIQQTQEINARQRQEQLRRALATTARPLWRARHCRRQRLGGSRSRRPSRRRRRARTPTLRSVTDLRIGKLNDQLDWQRRRNLLEASSSQYRSAFSLVQRGLRSVSLFDE